MEEKDELLNPEDFDDEVVDDDGKSKDKEASKKENSEEDDSNENAKSQKEKDSDEQKKKNAEYAKKRREQEEAERKKREAQLRAEIEKEVKLGLYKTNPYTNEPIVDEEDIKQYEIQKQLEDEGKDPLADYPKRVAELNRKAKKEAEAKEESQKKEQEFFKKDIADFKEKYPDVDLRKLADDNDFIEFSDGKTGRWSTAEIYEAYLQKKENDAFRFKKKETDDEAKEKAKNITKTPSATGQRSPKTSLDDIKTPEEMQEYINRKYH